MGLEHDRQGDRHTLAGDHGGAPGEGSVSVLGMCLLAAGGVLLPLTWGVAKSLRLDGMKYALYVWAVIADLALSMAGGSQVADAMLGLLIAVLGLAATVPVIVVLERRVDPANRGG
ncbi:MAG: hypothetical protein HY875_03620 [Chloroflexi bacterium]|nr:hypothetical protein [Chloroflexota bacterium]